MKVSILILFVALLLVVPFFVFADCSNSGATVIFINGMFTSNEEQAREAKKNIEYQYKIGGKGADVSFLLGYNPSHIAGLGDIVNVTTQAYKGGYLDYDLTNILKQAHKDLKTQKILLVGHSQGTFYTNAAYYYLINNGVDEKSIAVYNIGTPADKVAGNGKYLTSSTDKVINSIAHELMAMSFARSPLSPNIDIKLSGKEASSLTGGHAFGEVYLAEAPDRIISDMDELLGSLEASDSNKSECFVEPKTGVPFLIQDVGYKGIDTSIMYFGQTPTSPLKSVDQAAAIAEFLFKKVYNFGSALASGVGNYVASLNPAMFVTSMLPGYTLQESTGENITLGDQTQQDNPPPDESITDYEGIGGPIIAPMTEAEMQDLLDSIQEKLDILNQQVQELFTQYNGTGDTTEDGDELVDNNPPDDQDNKTNNQNNNTNTGGGSGGSGNSVNYLKILISEVKISEKTGDKNVFVELYNPNDKPVNLTNWRIFRNNSSFITDTMLAGKEILKNGYFLITKQGSIWDGPDNQSFDGTLNNNDKISLKNPNREITDEISWTTISTDLSFGRKWDAINNTEQEFELQVPTPRAQNVTYIALPVQKDTTAPIITINGIPEITITVGGIYIDEGAIALDNIDGDITANMVIVNTVDVNLLGDYTITYNVSDLAGNLAVEVTRLIHVVATVPEPKILINEIQIDSVDGVGGTNDDWVELYNPNDVDVSLSGWSIQKSGYKKDDCTVDTSFDSKHFDSDSVVPAKGFYLIASTKAEDSLKALAVAPNGMTISWTLTDNNTIYLVRNTDKITDYKDLDIVDEVGYGTACFSESDSPAISPPEGKSIERKIIGVDTDNNWNDFMVSYAPTPREQNKPTPSSDASVTSNIFTVSPLVGGMGTITNIIFNTSRATFESSIVPATGAMLNFDNITDPVVTGNTLVVTAEDGTQATYIISVNAKTIVWSQGPIDSFTPEGVFTFGTSGFMPNITNWCAFSIGDYRDTYPSMTNGGVYGGGPCNDAYPFYKLDMSSYKIVGEYDVYLSYCGGDIDTYYNDKCDDGQKSDLVGNYYRTYFDGLIWGPVIIP